jgi:hypothetical protein
VPSTMLIPREGSLLLAASGSLRIVCEPTAVNLAWNWIFGINHQTFGRVVPLWARSTDPWFFGNSRVHRSLLTTTTVRPKR